MPSACAAPIAASALVTLWAWEKLNSSVGALGAGRDLDAQAVALRLDRQRAHVRGRTGDRLQPPIAVRASDGANVIDRTSERRCGSQRLLGGRHHARRAGRAARAISSAFASATRSTVPTSSRCTGPTFVITPTSGRAIWASSRICPMPRIAISSTSSSVPCSASSTVSGSPISVLKFSRLACTRPPNGGASSAQQDVLGRRLAGRAGDADHAAAVLAEPVEPCARPARRAPPAGPRTRTRVRPRRPRDALAEAVWAPVTIAPHAPASIAAAANAPAVRALAGQADEQVAGAGLRESRPPPARARRSRRPALARPRPAVAPARRARSPSARGRSPRP